MRLEAALVGSYNYSLVALSVLIAMLASYAALDLAGRITVSRGRLRIVWLMGDASAMGWASGRCTISECSLTVFR